MAVIQLLGRPAIHRPGGRGPHPRGRKAWALLAMATLSERPVPRHRLSRMLFPEADDAPAGRDRRRQDRVPTVGAGRRGRAGPAREPPGQRRRAAGRRLDHRHPPGRPICDVATAHDLPRAPAAVAELAALSETARMPAYAARADAYRKSLRPAVRAC